MTTLPINAIITRVKNILMTPATEWDKIAGESATIQGLYKNYACLLAALPMIAQFLRSIIHGYFGVGLAYPIVAYISGLVGLAAIAFVADFAAPKFGGQSNQINAFKLSVYSATASWIAGSFVFIPVIGPLITLASLYSLYIFFLGAPKLMKVPQAQAGIFTVVVVVVAAAISVVIAMATTPHY